MTTGANAVLDVVESAYQPANDTETWLRGIAKGFDAALGDGSGTIALIPRTSDTPSRFEHAVGVDIGDWWREQVDTFEQIPRPIYDSFARAGLLYWSQIAAGLNAAQTGFFEERAQALHGASDDEVLERARAGRDGPGDIPAERLAMACYDATGRGVGVIVARRQLANGPASPAENQLWSRVAAHVAAGLRLRLRGEVTPETSEAILDGSGRLQHASGSAKESAAREALRDAAVARDRVRTRRARGREAEYVTAQWKALVGGRWSLLDSFDRDGRRFVIAQPNAPEVTQFAALSPREAQVVACAALGHANKLIAYELGLSPSTVAGHLARAAVKLGVTSRAALIGAVDRRSA